MGDYLRWEVDFAAGSRMNDCRDRRAGRRLLHQFQTAGTYGNLERLSHLYIPVGLSIKSHGGNLLDEVASKGILVAGQAQRP